jgi:DNA adenine methylase
MVAEKAAWRPLRAPITYYGGKGRIAHRIVDLLPPHDVYLEPFCGSAAVFFRKPPCALETLNDVADGVVTFYRVLRDPEQFAQFQMLCALTPHSRVEFEHCRQTWFKETEPARMAWAWFVMARQSFGGHVTGAGHAVVAGWKQTATTGAGTIWSRRTESRNGSTWGYRTNNSMGSAGRRVLSAIEGLAAVHARLQGVQIEHLDWRVALERYATPAALCYLDPPYVPDTRVGGARYEHEMSLDDHHELTERLLSCPSMVVLSGYWHAAVHDPLEAAGWERIDLEVPLSVARDREGARRTESLWSNPAAIAARRQPSLFGQEDRP